MAHLQMIFPLKPPLMVGIFHGYVSHNQMVIFFKMVETNQISNWNWWWFLHIPTGFWFLPLGYYGFDLVLTSGSNKIQAWVACRSRKSSKSSSWRTTSLRTVAVISTGRSSSLAKPCEWNSWWIDFSAAERWSHIFHTKERLWYGY